MPKHLNNIWNSDGHNLPRQCVHGDSTLCIQCKTCGEVGEKTSLLLWYPAISKNEIYALIGNCSIHKQ